MTTKRPIGALLCRFATGKADLLACQALRHQAFFGTDGCDADRFDPLCKHLMIERDGALVCTLRLRVFGAGEALTESYTGRFYDLSHMQGPAIELGRFCLRDRGGQADVMRLALSEITRLVDETKADFLFGCTSFSGNDPALYSEAFACLAAHYQGPADRIPVARDAAIALPHAPFDLLVALRQMPKLLRSYLGMHGWVGDAVVIDARLQTMHVFTRLDVGAVPEARAMALRNSLIAGQQA